MSSKVHEAIPDSEAEAALAALRRARLDAERLALMTGTDLIPAPRLHYLSLVRPRNHPETRRLCGTQGRLMLWVPDEFDVMPVLTGGRAAMDGIEGDGRFSRRGSCPGTLPCEVRPS
jgi:hypothetical protein